MIYTAHYRYFGPDRIDITVKGNDPLFKGLAPTWDMVNAYKAGRLSAVNYATKYFNLIDSRINQGDQSAMNLHRAFLENGSITLVCFCPSGNFCHRYLLAHKITNDWGIAYGGERA